MRRGDDMALNRLRPGEAGLPAGQLPGTHRNAPGEKAPLLPLLLSSLPQSLPLFLPLSLPLSVPLLLPLSLLLFLPLVRLPLLVLRVLLKLLSDVKLESVSPPVSEQSLALVD